MKKTVISFLIGITTIFSPDLQAALPYNNISRTVMNTYNDMLRENFKDYEVLYRRANQYYHHQEYLKALDDLDSAVKYAPVTDTEMLFPIYALRSATYWQMKRYTLSLQEINKALEIDPSNYAAVNMRADIEVELGNYTAAKEDYTKLQRLNSRSQEALFGLAKVAAKESNYGLASEYMEKAVSLTPTQSDVYVNRAQVKAMMNDYNGAVDDLILALATDASDPHALPRLIDMANSNYAAVMNGLSSAIRTAPRTPLYYFLRGSIAAAHFHYAPAIDDFKYIIDNNLYNYSGLYASLAECYYALGDYETALDNANTALSNYTEDDDVAHYYTVRARVLRALKQYDKAISATDRALELTPDSKEAMTEKALILTSLKKGDEASQLLGEVIMNEPYDPMPYLTRAWVLNDYLNEPKAAKGFYQRVVDLELDHSERIGSMLGFAYLFNGNTAKGISWIEECLTEPDYDGQIHYYGACFYAWAGRTEKALDCMEQALKNGYANYHNWTANDDNRINVAPIRDTPRFNDLLKAHASIFDK